MAGKRKSDTTQIGNDDVAALRAELDALKGENSTLISQRDTASAEAKKARLATMSADERALVSAQEANEATLNSLESEASSIEDQIATLADEPGHGKEIAALTRKLSTLSADLVDEGKKKKWLEGQRAKFTERAAETAEDPNDKTLANGSKLSAYGQKTQAWLLAHPKAFTDSRYMARAIAAAIKATGGEGIADQSAEYFKFIEDELGETPAPTEEEEVPADEEGEEIAQPARQTQERYEPEKPQARAAGGGSVAAVVQTALRSSSTGGARRTPALTAAQKEVADSLYGSMPAAERYIHYAKMDTFMKNRETGHFRSN